jgi:hypothetical protein
MNDDRLGIPALKAERASWRATKAARFNVDPGFVLLATVPPPSHMPDGWSMLLMAHDARDGAGTYLRGAWWLGRGRWESPVRAFSQFVGRFGVKLATERTDGVFYLSSPDEIPPQPVGVRLDDVELHALRQTRQFEGETGWAWCFGINRRKHRDYLQAIEGKR